MSGANWLSGALNAAKAGLFPTVPSVKMGNWEQTKNCETPINSGFADFVLSVPSVPSEKQPTLEVPAKVVADETAEGAELSSGIIRDNAKTDHCRERVLDLAKPVEPLPTPLAVINRSICFDCRNMSGKVCAIAKPEAGALVVAMRGWRPIQDSPVRWCAGFMARSTLH